MRITIVILIIALQPLLMKSQTAIATLGNIASCAGEDVLVPMDVVDFNDVGAMTIFIGYDTNVAVFNSILNINPQIPGFISYNDIGGQVNIAYSNPNPFYISGEKLFDLSFTYLDDSTLLTFNPGTEIANTMLEIIPLESYPGSIFNSIEIINQPDSVQAYPNNDVFFKITSVGNTTYQWQEDSGSGWTNLQNNGPYSGVNSDSLSISNVPLSFNENLYQCILTYEECTLASEIALLEVATAFPVATIGQAASCPANIVSLPVYAGDLFDIIEFNFNISFDTTELTFLELENIHPDLQSGEMVTSPLPDQPGITIHWTNENPVTVSNGMLFQMKFFYELETQPLTFEEGTVVINSSFNPLTITLNDGMINQYVIPYIILQPVNDTVLKNGTAEFSVEATNAVSFQWLVSEDGGNSWDELDDAIPYYNTQTPVLTISPASLDLHEYKYACRLASNYCSVFSEPAVLIVDTLTFISQQQEKDFISVYPNPVKDIINIDVPEKLDGVRLELYTLDGRMLLREALIPNNGASNYRLNISGMAESIYLLKFSAEKSGKIFTEENLIFRIH